MINIEEEYLGLLSGVYHGGRDKQGRNGMTKHVFGRQIRHSMSLGFPLLTTKRIWFKGAKVELLWILQGRTDIKYLQDNGVSYWDLNYEQSGRDDGTLGPVYGYQVRHGFYVDQLEELLNNLRDNPNSRRHIVTMWNPNDTIEAALPPCHYGFQVNIDGEYMDLMWNQRSVDLFLGLPFDIAMYALLLEILAKGANKIPRDLIGSLGDCHIYDVHNEAVQTQLNRKIGTLPTLDLQSGLYIKDGEINIPPLHTINIKDYNPQEPIKAILV